MAELQRMFPNASSSLMDSNFHPAVLLVERYQKTPFEEFKEGEKAFSW